ncbi:unnamed protein product, partial [Rotaria sp. Silwood2]
NTLPNVFQEIFQTSDNYSLITDQSNDMNQKNDADNKCKICMKNNIDYVLLEYAHMVSCLACASYFTMYLICRRKSNRIKKIFRS